MHVHVILNVNDLANKGVFWVDLYLRFLLCLGIYLFIFIHGGGEVTPQVLCLTGHGLVASMSVAVVVTFSELGLNFTRPSLVISLPFFVFRSPRKSISSQFQKRLGFSCL